MSKINNQQNSEEIGNKGENYKMSLDILSSLKSIPGKIIKLQSDNFQSEKENFNKDKTFNDSEEKFSTFNTLSKDILSKEYYYMKAREELCTQNSLFMQYPYNNQAQLGYHTHNYFINNSLLFLPGLIFPNQNYMIYPYKTFNSVCPIKSINCFKEFKVNPSNSVFNKISFPMRKVPVIQIPIETSSKDDDNSENTQNKNHNLLNIENINKKINIINNDVIKNNNSILNKKRNRTESNNIYFLVKKEQKKSIENSSFKKNKFNVYKKSKYVFRKRKKRIKNNLNLNRIKINCSHKGCESIFKTKKQLAFHHYKMSIECHYDTISLLKLIASVKKLLLNQTKNTKKINVNNIWEKYSLLYKETMNNMPLEEYIETIVGFNLED